MAKKSASKFGSLLKKAAATWNEGKKKFADGGGDNFPSFDDGRYEGRIVGAEIAESQSSGRLQVNWKFEFTKGTYKGKTVMDFSGLDNETSVMFLHKRLDQLGYEDVDLEQLEDVLAEIVKDKPSVVFRLRTKGDYQNLFIDKVRGSASEDEEEEEDEDEGEEAEETGDDEEESDDEESEEEEEESEDEESEEESDDEEEEEGEEEEEEEEEESEEEEEEEEEEESEEEEAELTVGAKVAVQTKAGEKNGEVLEILAKEGQVRVKTADGKILKVGVEKIELLADEEDVPEEPAPAKKGKKTPPPPPPPAKKKAKK